MATWLRGAMAHGKFESQGAVAEKAKVSRETVNNLLNQKVDADQATLTKLAEACGVPIPSVEWRFSPQGGPQKPLDVLGWVSEAQAALGQVARLLERQTSAPPGDGGRAGRAIVKATRRKKARPPAQDQPKKAG